MIKTLDGRLGLASKDVRKGDKICIFYGCSVPILLRLNEQKKDDDYKAELNWEIDYTKKAMNSCCTRYAKRKRENRKHRDEQTAKQFLAWHEKQDWFEIYKYSKSKKDWKERLPLINWRQSLIKGSRYKIRTVSVNDSKPKKEAPRAKELELLYMIARFQFRQWLVHQRVEEWAQSPFNPEKKKSYGVNDGDNPGRRETPPVGVAAGDENETENKGGVVEIVWWDFELQIKFFRRWKRIVRTKNKLLLKEWRLHIDSKKSKGYWRAHSIWPSESHGGAVGTIHHPPSNAETRDIAVLVPEHSADPETSQRQNESEDAQAGAEMSDGSMDDSTADADTSNEDNDQVGSYSQPSPTGALRGKHNRTTPEHPNSNSEMIRSPW